SCARSSIYFLHPAAPTHIYTLSLHDALPISTAARQTEALSRRASERLAALQHEAETLATQEQTLLVGLRKLEVEREIKQEELAKVGREAADVQRQLTVASTRARALPSEAERQRPATAG